MGSNNVVVLERRGQRAGLAPTIAVGEGPTGIVVDERATSSTCSTSSRARSRS
jgi:hypothetical protein